MCYIDLYNTRGLMSKTEMIRARIEPQIKRAVEALLAQAGLTHSDFVGMIYREAVRNRELPINISLKPEFREWLDSLPVSKNIPNKKTKAALRASSKGLPRYKNFKQIGDESD